MTRLNIALLSLLLPTVFAVPAKPSAHIQSKVHSTTALSDTSNSISLSTTVSDSMLSSSLAATIASSESPESSGAPVHNGTHGCSPAIITVTAIKTVSQRASHVARAARTKGPGALAASSSVLSASTGPYANTTDTSSQTLADPTATGGSGHGHKTKSSHKTKSAHNTNSPHNTKSPHVKTRRAIPTGTNANATDISSQSLADPTGTAASIETSSGHGNSTNSAHKTKSSHNTHLPHNTKSSHVKTESADPTETSEAEVSEATSTSASSSSDVALATTSL